MFIKYVLNRLVFLGVIGLYNGISASLLRQLTYSLARFGIYDVGKQLISTKEVSICF